MVSLSCGNRYNFRRPISSRHKPNVVEICVSLFVLDAENQECSRVQLASQPASYNYLNFMEKWRLSRDFFRSVVGVLVVEEADDDAAGVAVGDASLCSALESSGVERACKNASSSSSVSRPGSARRLDFFLNCKVSLTLDYRRVTLQQLRNSSSASYKDLSLSSEHTVKFFHGDRLTGTTILRGLRACSNRSASSSSFCTCAAWICSRSCTNSASCS